MNPEDDRTIDRNPNSLENIPSDPEVLTHKVLCPLPFTVREFWTQVFNSVTVNTVCVNQFRQCLERI